MLIQPTVYISVSKFLHEFFCGVLEVELNIKKKKKNSPAVHCFAVENSITKLI